MKTPVQVVREVYDRYARRDFAGIFELLSPGIEVHQTDLLPWGGQHVGHAGARRFFALLAEYTDAMPTVSTCIEAGSDVAVVGRLVGTARKTGKTIEIDIVHVWKIEQERVARFTAYIDTPAMLEALQPTVCAGTRPPASGVVTLRQATGEDLAVLMPYFRAYQEHYGTMTSASEEQTRSFLQGLLADAKAGFVLLAFIDAIPCGFATVYFTVSGLIAQRLAHLGDLYVAPEFRKRGVGTALFEAVANEAQARGIGLVRWLAVSSNAAVNAWYAKKANFVGTFELYLRETKRCCLNS